MMGRREGGQGQFFYSFDLDKVVPPDHLVRQIDGVLDLGWVHKELAPYYSHTGRPSIDPVLMIRMLIVGYVFAIRSERRLCAEVEVNLAYRWFCKLGIEDKIPDHSVFCRARHERFRESDAVRRVFEGVVAMCIAAGLVGGEAFSVDASLIKADVDKKKRVAGEQPIAWPKAEEASHAVREYLAALDAARNTEENEDGDGGGSSGSGNRSKPPKEVSLTDPQATWIARPGVDPFFAYDANYLIDNKVGDHPRRRGHTSQPHSGDCRHPDDGGARSPPLRSAAPEARRRHGLWCGQAAQVADGSQDHTARSGVGQVGAP
jgi:transposase